jgi:hypothetical protein
MAGSLCRLFAQHLPENYHHATAKVLFESLLDLAGQIQIEGSQIIVTLDKRARNPYLVDSGLADQPTAMPCLEGKELVIKFALPERLSHSLMLAQLGTVGIEASPPCGLSSLPVRLSHTPFCSENTAFYKAKILPGR